MKYCLFILGSHQRSFLFTVLHFQFVTQLVHLQSNIFNHCEQGNPWPENGSECDAVASRNLSRAEEEPQVHRLLCAAWLYMYITAPAHNNQKQILTCGSAGSFI